VSQTVTPLLKCLYIVYFDRNKIMSSSTTQNPKWNLIADYIETCNCDYGCPCIFSGFPTYGSCHALLLFHIRSGVTAMLGLMVLILSLLSIGRRLFMKETVLLKCSLPIKQMKSKDRPSSTFIRAKQREMLPLHYLLRQSYFLEPQFVDIKINLNGKKSSFSVAGVMDVQTEGFANPVTGEEQDTKIQLPKGLVWKLAEAAKTKIMRITTQSLNYDHSGQNAFNAVVEYKGP
jgi:hypothetical protein